MTAKSDTCHHHRGCGGGSKAKNPRQRRQQRDPSFRFGRLSVACQTHHCVHRWAEFSQRFCSLPCTFCEHILLRIRTSIQVSKDLQLSTSVHLYRPLNSSVSADNSLFWWYSPWQDSKTVLIRNLPKLAINSIILRSCADAFSTGTPPDELPHVLSHCASLQDGSHRYFHCC